MRLRIATYNIHKSTGGIPGRPRILDVRHGLHSLDADIAFLQEVQDINHAHVRRQAAPAGQLAFLAGDVYAHSVYGMNAVYNNGHHGNAILSRLPITGWENIDISDHMLEKRGLLHAVARLPEDEDGPGGDLHLLCVHLGLFQGSRERQGRALVARVREAVPDDAPLVIAGDFNDWRNRLHGPLMRELGLTEAYSENHGEGLEAGGARLPRPARTFPAGLPWLRLDRIYLRGCRVETAGVARGRSWARRSDHAPLCAQIVVTPPAARR
ncbi:MAG: endonuclease/exonuclease/phosphatase family protein [Candidatus Protistobacter heckmanni]|nr:endonuclease/exonuclease/phosphatase family protein [Candidatus Protistobacter heckmanni]